MLYVSNQYVCIECTIHVGSQYHTNSLTNNMNLRIIVESKWETLAQQST